MSFQSSEDMYLWFDQPTANKSNIDKPEGETSDQFFSSLQSALAIKSFSLKMARTESGHATEQKGSKQKEQGWGKFDGCTIRRSVDMASSYLMRICYSQAMVPNVMLIVREAGGNQMIYLQFLFRYVSITNIGWSAGDTLPEESLDLKFRAMAMSYSPQNVRGVAEPARQASWHDQLNQEILVDWEGTKPKEFFPPFPALPKK